MYRPSDVSALALPDVEAFVRTLNNLDQSPTPEARSLFADSGDLFVARAPGRLDVMGGIADYSGSMVLQLPLREATLVAVQRDPSAMIRIVSLGAEANNRAADFEMSLSDFGGAGCPIEYAEARDRFRRDQRRAWAAYVAGAFLVLMRERGERFSQGARILVSSSVPEGKGVSSSAALEVAAMQAIAAAFDLRIEPRDLALLCQKVENLVVGAPCGVMDQMTAACGRADRLLALVCQPAELKGTIAIPDDIAFWGLDSGERHAVSGADYGTVRVGAFMGYRIIARLAGLTVEEANRFGTVVVRDPRWHGYLANITPAEFERDFAPHLPEQMDSFMFMAQYDGITDAVSRVEGGRTYPVRRPTAHPVYENDRVRAFAALLGAAGGDERLRALGEMMFASHASYAACGLGSPGTDRLVELVRAAGPASGLYGARITGGGSGGTVAVLARSSAGEAIRRIADEYGRCTGYTPHVFSGSSPGAAEFGCVRLVRC